MVLTNSGNGLSIVPAITAGTFDTTHPAFAWMGYDTYDSPASVLRREVIGAGTAEVLPRVRKDDRPILTEAQWNSMGYQLLSRRRIDDAIAIFELNTELFPRSGNTFDSLGDAYLAAGRTNEALRSYAQALALDPANDNARQLVAKLKGRQH